MTIAIAHRGFSGLYPENTMLAFEKALETGCEGIEFDVHLTADGQLVIIHDETLDRTTDGTGFVGQHTLAQLKALDASKGPHAAHGPQKIPTLREYFELIRGRDILTNIELKTGIFWYEGIEEKTLELIDEFGRRDSVLISSFNHYSILKIKELAPEIKVAFLEESRLIDPAGYLESHGVGYYHPMFPCMIQQEVLAALKAGGITVNVWTVDEADHMAMVMNMVDGVITNYPDRFLRLRQDTQKS